MKFSLIVPTKGRVQELERLFRSLAMQTLTDFEVIISDQNDDDRLVKLVQKFSSTRRILHLRSDHGISRARNVGIARASGEIVCFPDDDCAYPPHLLEHASAFFDQHPEYAFLTGRSYSDDGKDAIARHDSRASKIFRTRIHRQCIEHAFFIRKAALGDLLFDEAMGVGAPTPWQADEGPDLMLRLEAKQAHGYYDPSIAVWHPRSSDTSNPLIFNRAYRYACGNGYFLRKHHYSVWYFRGRLLRTFLGACLALALFKGRKVGFYLNRLKGLWRGWHSYPEKS